MCTVRRSKIKQHTNINDNHTPSTADLLCSLCSRFSDDNASGDFLLTLLEICGQQNYPSGHDSQEFIHLSGWRDERNGRCSSIIMKSRSSLRVRCSELRGTIVNPSSLHDISVSVHLNYNKTLPWSQARAVLDIHCFFYYTRGKLEERRCRVSEVVCWWQAR